MTTTKTTTTKKPTTKKSRFRLGLGTSLFVIIPGTILVVMVLAAILTASLAGGIAREAIAADLKRSFAGQETFQEKNYEQLQLISRVFVNDPYLTAYVAEAASSFDSLSVLDLLSERQADLGFDFAIVLDADGAVLARTDKPDASGEDLSEKALIAEALEEYRAVGVWQQRGELFHASVVPLARGRDLIGFLLTGFAVTDTTVLEVRRVSRTEVVYMTVDDGKLELAASTLNPELGSALLGALERRADVLGRVLETEEQVEEVEVELLGEAWICLLSPLADVAGAAVGMTVTLASLEEELLPYRRIQSLVLFAGAAAAIAAFLLAFAVSRQTLRPLRRLAAAATAARDGDYDQPIAVESDDEIGDLALAFRDLLRDLRERRDMETYLGEIYRSLPERDAERPSAMIRPTTALAGGTSESASAREPSVGDTIASTPITPGRLQTLSQIDAGSVLGRRFEILSELGSGGMAVVYKAYDRELDEIVALKVLKDGQWDDPLKLERLKEEIKLARRITHKNVLRTYDLGEIDGISFISMEYVHGITLRDLLKRTDRVPYSSGLRLAKQLCYGLATAHDVGVIHRDIKPENLLIDPTGTAKLMDFGIARTVGGSASRLTQEGSVVGTPLYLAPEQIAGDEPDLRVDIYASGVVFYEVFTGKAPFTAGSLQQLILAKLHKDPDLPSTHWPEIPEALETLIMTCLAQEPGKRYPTVHDLLRDLETLSG